MNRAYLNFGTALKEQIWGYRNTRGRGMNAKVIEMLFLKS